MATWKAFLAGVAGLAISPVSFGAADPCPQGRSLERQIRQADVVALGTVLLEPACPPHRTDNIEEDRVCLSAQVEITIRKSWKGPPAAGHYLLLPMALDKPSMRLNDGDTVVVFAKLRGLDQNTSPVWFGNQTLACFPMELIQPIRI
jgi:hypothetical protein